MKVPLADPVEQRWEESAGKYLHKKFKKIAAVESSEPTPPAPPPPVASAPTSAVASAPADPAVHNSGAPLNHSVLSMLSSPQRAQPGSVVQHQQLRPPVPMPTDLSSKRLPAPPQQQQQQSKHLQISTQPKSDVLVCPLCRAAVSARDSDRHIRAHCSLASAARPYRCDACRFAFRLSSSLERHIRFVANIFNFFHKKPLFLNLLLRSRSHALRMEKGQESHALDVVAELGEAVRDEMDPPIQPAAPIPLTVQRLHLPPPSQQQQQQHLLPQRPQQQSPQQVLHLIGRPPHLPPPSSSLVQPQQPPPQRHSLLHAQQHPQAAAVDLAAIQRSIPKETSVVNLSPAVHPPSSRPPPPPPSSSSDPRGIHPAATAVSSAHLAAASILQQSRPPNAAALLRQQPAPQALVLPPARSQPSHSQVPMPPGVVSQAEAQRLLLQQQQLQQQQPRVLQPAQQLARPPPAPLSSAAATLGTLRYAQPILVQARPQPPTAAAAVPPPPELRPRLPTAPLPLIRAGAQPPPVAAQTAPTDLSAKRSAAVPTTAANVPQSTAETLQQRIDKVISENQVRKDPTRKNTNEIQCPFLFSN